MVARRDFLPLFLAFAGYNLAGLLLYVYYGIEIGVLDARKSIGCYVLVLVVGPGGPIAAYCLRKRFLKWP